MIQLDKQPTSEREASATVTFPEAGPGDAVLPVHDDGLQWQPLVAVAAAILIAALLGVMLLRRRRRARAAAAAPGSRRARRENADVRN